MPATDTCTAFTGHRLIASGPLEDVTLACKQALDAGANEPLLVFDDHSSQQVEIDFRGTVRQVLARLKASRRAQETPAIAQAMRGPGRPKLGVVAREVTLLPRHWDWLGNQPGGASGALRRLVEDARHRHDPRDRARRSSEAVDRFMRVIAGDLPGYEEASRRFYRGDRVGFTKCIARWPKDVRTHLRRLAAIAWDDAADAVT